MFLKLFLIFVIIASSLNAMRIDRWEQISSDLRLKVKDSDIENLNSFLEEGRYGNSGALLEIATILLNNNAVNDALVFFRMSDQAAEKWGGNLYAKVMIKQIENNEN